MNRLVKKKKTGEGIQGEGELQPPIQEPLPQDGFQEEKVTVLFS